MVIAVGEGALLCLLGVVLVLSRRASKRRRDMEAARLDALQRVADERAVALDYIVRARVVDYVYEYVGYEITVDPSSEDRIERVMVFGPPQDKDIICKRITLVEGQGAPAQASVHDFGFEASVYAPLPDLVDSGSETPPDPRDETAWRFESHPWVLPVPPDTSGEVRAILVFTPMISEERRLTMRYRWPAVFPELTRGSTSSRGRFSILKHARLLEFAVRLPADWPEARLFLQGPGHHEPVEGGVRNGTLVCSLRDAPRGEYRYTLALARPSRP